MTLNALLKRIRRALAHADRSLKTARLRGGYEDSNVGRYYIIRVSQNILEDHHIDLEDLGHTLGVLPAGETIETVAQHYARLGLRYGGPGCAGNFQPIQDEANRARIHLVN